MPENHAVYASNFVSEKIGFISEYISEIVGKPSIIINRSDLLNSDVTEALKDPAGTVERAVENTQNIFEDLMVSGGIPNTSHSEGYMKALYADFAHRAIMDQPSAGGFDFTGNGVKDFAVIISPANLDEPFNITNFSSDLFKPKWTAVESNALVFLHEAKHFNQNGTVLMNEIDSDSTAIKMYRKAIEDGHPLREIGIEELKAQRLVSSFVSPGNDIDLFVSGFNQLVGDDTSVLGQTIDNATHTTHLALDDTENILENASAMINVRTMNNMILGMDQLMRANEEFVSDGKYSIESKMRLNANDPIEVYGDTFPLNMLDAGSLVAVHDPVRSLASAEAMVEAGIFQEGGAEYEYIKEVGDFFKERGDILHQSPEFLAEKEHFKEFIQKSGLKAEMDFSEVFSKEIMSLNDDVESLEGQVSNYYTKLVSAAYDAGNEYAVEALDGVWRGDGEFFSHSSDASYADDIADHAQKIMMKFDEVLKQYPDIQDHYDVERTTTLPPSAVRLGDSLGISNAIRNIEADAVDLNKKRPEMGLSLRPEIEMGMP